MTAAARRGFRIVVHTRFDARVDPMLEAPTLCFDASLDVPHIDLLLYNNTGVGVTGFHYDPGFVQLRSQRRGNAVAKNNPTGNCWSSEFQGRSSSNP